MTPGASGHRLPLPWGPSHAMEHAWVDDGPSSDEAGLVDLLSRHPTSDRPQVLVIDDFHLITAPAVLSALARLVHHLPPHIRVVLVGQGHAGLLAAAARDERGGDDARGRRPAFHRRGGGRTDGPGRGQVPRSQRCDRADTTKRGLGGRPPFGRYGPGACGRSVDVCAPIFRLLRTGRGISGA